MPLLRQHKTEEARQGKGGRNDEVGGGGWGGDGVVVVEVVMRISDCIYNEAQRGIHKLAKSGPLES